MYLVIPATAVVRSGESAKDFGIRYYGTPSGCEFTSLLEDITLVGGGLNDEANAWMGQFTGKEPRRSRCSRPK